MNFQAISEFLDLIKNPAKYEKYLTELKDAKDQLQAAAELVGNANEIEKLQTNVTKLVEKAEAKTAKIQAEAEAAAPASATLSNTAAGYTTLGGQFQFAAVATTPTVLQWALGVGSTAVSLATTEAAAARAPRRITLGTQAFPVGAAIGADAGKRIDVNLDAPVVVEPGTFLHIILKMPVGTATASQIIRGVVGINAYWE